VQGRSRSRKAVVLGCSAFQRRASEKNIEQVDRNVASTRILDDFFYFGASGQRWCLVERVGMLITLALRCGSRAEFTVLTYHL
jgi:hypothetical protein